MASPTPEQYSKVSYLYDSLSPKPTELLNRGRYYIREGPLLVWDENRKKKSKRYIFLLNDALLIVKRDGRTKFFLRVFINLRSQHVGVEDMSSGFDHAFRLSVKTRSFVFFSDSDVQGWISDVERSVRGTDEEKKDSRKSMGSANFGTGLSKGLGEGSSKPSKGGNQNFTSFTDGDFVETKVNFDSGMKLGGIRSGSGIDGAAIPVLAPPPARRNSTTGALSASPISSPTAAYATTTTAPPPAAAGVPSLVDFLGLSIAPTTTNPPAVAKPAPAVAPAPTSNLMDLWATPAPTTAAAPQFPPSPFGAPAVAPATVPASHPFGTAPSQTASLGLQAAYSGQPSQTNANAFNPFATPAPAASYPFGAPSAYPATYGTAPAYTAQPGPFGAAPANNDPFAMFAVPSASQPAKGSKPVDFF
jgi:hypothetical protein